MHRAGLHRQQGLSAVAIAELQVTLYSLQELEECGLTELAAEARARLATL